MKLPKIKTYREFLKTYGSGEGTDEMFSKERKRVEQTFDKAQSTYGANAEALSSAGLSRSGYASYLDEQARGAYQEARSEVALAEQAEENKRFSSYEAYLEKMRKEEDSAETQVHRTILSSKTTDMESGMRLASIYGLSGDAARKVVEYAIKLNVERKRQDILDKIRTQRTSPQRAEEYARLYHLPEDVVKEIKEFAGKLYGYNALAIQYEQYEKAN